MSMLNVPADAFSHSQIKSKLWLAQHLNIWLPKHTVNREPLDIINWYACWIGLGPLLYLGQAVTEFREHNFYDVDAKAIENAEKVLNYLRCERPYFNLITADINDIKTQNRSDQLFINTSCEHIQDRRWLQNIPKNALVLMQSTNMPHPEHVNLSDSLEAFSRSASDEIAVLESAQLDFNYPNLPFSRFMIFGCKK